MSRSAQRKGIVSETTATVNNPPVDNAMLAQFQQFQQFQQMLADNANIVNTPSVADPKHTVSESCGSNSNGKAKRKIGVKVGHEDLADCLADLPEIDETKREIFLEVFDRKTGEKKKEKHNQRLYDSTRRVLKPLLPDSLTIRIEANGKEIGKSVAVLKASSAGTLQYCVDGGTIDIPVSDDTADGLVTINALRWFIQAVRYKQAGSSK